MSKTIGTFLLISLLTVSAGGQNRTTGSIKGKVRVEGGSTAAEVSVVARQNEREVARTTTGHKGEFVFAGLAPGSYGLTFRKPGLSVGSIESVQVIAGKENKLPDRLILTVDEGTLAFLRGSVFKVDGRSFPGARVELARIEPDGTAKKIDGRVTNETGQFVFRLMPAAAKYRVTAKADGVGPALKEIEIDGAAIYRIALTLQPAAK